MGYRGKTVSRIYEWGRTLDEPAPVQTPFKSVMRIVKRADIEARAASAPAAPARALEPRAHRVRDFFGIADIERFRRLRDEERIEQLARFLA